MARRKTLSIEDAKRLAIELLAALENSKLPEGMAVAEIFENYMSRHGSRRKSAVKMRQLFDRHIACFKDRPVHTLTSQEIFTWHSTIGQTHGLATANRCLEVLRAAINKNIKWGLYSGVNPCNVVSPFPLDSRDRYLSRKTEIEKFLNAVAQMRSQTFRAFALTALFTGARVSNVYSMRWDDVDLENNVWRIPMTKSGKPVLVPLIPEALAAINSQKGLHDIWVFPGRGKTGHMVSPGRSWERLMDRAGITDLHMHDLRRTMGSWQANTGASLHIIGKTLGHSSTRATHIYARLQLDPVRESMMKAVSAMLEK